MQYSRVEDNHFPTNSLLRVKEKLIDLSAPKVMGIININEDSFHEASRVNSDKELISNILKQVNEGVDIIDIGAESTRPGAKPIAEKVELEKIEKAVKIIKKEFPAILLSVDTYRSKVAQTALDLGADLINDISGGSLDVNMFQVVGRFNAPYIMMHMRGTPKTMQTQTSYENIIMDLILYFSSKMEEAKSHGIKDIIVDPGFGFSKTMEQNFELLKKIDHLKILEKPILVGLSRKSMIYNKLEISPNEALNGTTVLNTLALIKGASILRVHDVKEARQIISLIS